MKLTTKLLTFAALLLTATTTAAHTGHGTGGFTSGLLHPMLGLDHLLAMAAIGFWSVAGRLSGWVLHRDAGNYLGGAWTGRAAAQNGQSRSPWCGHSSGGCGGLSDGGVISREKPV